MAERVLRLTTTEATAAILRQYGHKVPDWRMRRVVDAMESAERLDVQRMGNYRTVSANDLALIVDELRSMGCLPELEVPSCKA